MDPRGLQGGIGKCGFLSPIKLQYLIWNWKMPGMMLWRIINGSYRRKASEEINLFRVALNPTLTVSSSLCCFLGEITFISRRVVPSLLSGWLSMRRCIWERERKADREILLAAHRQSRQRSRFGTLSGINWTVFAGEGSRQDGEMGKLGETWVFSPCISRWKVDRRRHDGRRSRLDSSSEKL